MRQRLDHYFATLATLPAQTQVTALDGKAIALEAAYGVLTKLVRATHAAGNKLMFIGNGGSAGIASHCATDYSKNGGIRSTAFNDGATLTFLGNDLGYENVFAQQINWHARGGDLLIAISSSGKSPNILRAVEVARGRGCKILTLSGFAADNPLRKLGDWNFHVNNQEYGFVEITHLTLIHTILDLEMGWGKEHA